MKAEINVEFTESPNRQELQSGEEIKTLFGKIKKWLTDLKPVAFSGSYNDLTDTPDDAINANAENIANIQSEIGDMESETIRADDADSEGKCQLYKTVNGERVDIEPKVSGSGLTTTYAEFAARIACGNFPDGVMVIPDGITSIGDYAFCTDASNGGSPKYKLIKSITIPNSVTSIGNSAFNSCTSLESVTIGNSVTSIGKNAFYNCTALRSVTIPDSVTSIGNDAFYNCYNVWKLIIAEGSETITQTIVICNSSLQSIIMPDSVTSIGKGAFNGCTSLSSITIGNGVTSIGDSAFSNCTSLSSITIPDSVTSIGDTIFGFSSANNTTRTFKIYYTGTEEQWNAITKGPHWGSYYNTNDRKYRSHNITMYYNYVPE